MGLIHSRQKRFFGQNGSNLLTPKKHFWAKMWVYATAATACFPGQEKNGSKFYHPHPLTIPYTRYTQHASLFRESAVRCGAVQARDPASLPHAHPGWSTSWQKAATSRASLSSGRSSESILVVLTMVNAAWVTLTACVKLWKGLGLYCSSTPRAKLRKVCSEIY